MIQNIQDRTNKTYPQAYKTQAWKIQKHVAALSHSPSKTTRELKFSTTNLSYKKGQNPQQYNRPQHTTLYKSREFTSGNWHISRKKNRGTRHIILP